MTELSLLKSDTGTYLLTMQCSSEQTVKVGAQGTIALRPGVYLYVGSAFGPGGIAARVRRHAGTDHVQHWHIDYIRPHCTLQGAWVSYADTKLECPWARALLDTANASVPREGLGSSDCNCLAHFIRWEAEEAVCYSEAHKQIEALLQNARPDVATVWVETDQIV